ncbi:MAG: hypothetical protein OXI40_11250 [Chloroflexota bacterium]|nr:hypothetical protein [Chloroflexota bacterium]
MSKLARIALIGLLALLSAIVAAETPDECAARLDQSTAIRTYDEAADWWAQVVRECAPQPASTITPEATEACDPSSAEVQRVIGLSVYGGCGELDFCVMSPTLNIRSTPGGSIIGSLNRGDIFTIDRAKQESANGFIWAKHDRGWSALYRSSGGPIDEYTYPEECRKPTRRPTPTTAGASRATHQVLQIGQTKTFQLSGADCAITASRGSSIEAGKLYIAAGRLGWLKDEFMVDIFAPGGRSALSFIESKVHDDEVGSIPIQLYTPQNTNEALGLYTIQVATYTADKKYNLRVSSKATYNIAVACE